MGYNNDLVSVEGEVQHETDQAILVDFGLEDKVWLPKSQLEDWPDVLDFGDIMLPQWLAEDKGIV